jgi:hypothetical protein
MPLHLLGQRAAVHTTGGCIPKRLANTWHVVNADARYGQASLGLDHQLHEELSSLSRR